MVSNPILPLLMPGIPPGRNHAAACPKVKVKQHTGRRLPPGFGWPRRRRRPVRRAGAMCQGRRMAEPFVHRLRVRYSECDQQGWVFNGHYLFFYDVAITELWRARIVPYQEMIDRGADLVVAEVRFNFRQGARFDDLVDIELNVKHLGTTSMVISPVFRVGDRLMLDGEVRHVFIDPATKGKTPIPDYIRTALSA
jgi:acyl-CoA thioester hydrolase